MTSISWVGLNFKNYFEYYEKRQEQHIQASKFLNLVCGDAEQKEEIGASNECIERRQMVRQSPSLYALYDVLQDWRLCGRSGCDVLLLNLSDHAVKLVVIVLIVYFLAMTLCGLTLRSGFNRQYVEPYQGFGQYESHVACKKLA